MTRKYLIKYLNGTIGRDPLVITNADVDMIKSYINHKGKVCPKKIKFNQDGQRYKSKMSYMISELMKEFNVIAIEKLSEPIQDTFANLMGKPQRTAQIVKYA